MNKTSDEVACIRDESELVRARFGPGMLLQHEDLERLNGYTRELSRLLFRSFFGCGVVCGLEVTATPDQCNRLSVNVSAGLALNCAGDPVHVPKDTPFKIPEDCNQDLPSPLWLVLCGATKKCAPRTAMCGDDDQSTSVCTRERDMFEIRVLKTRPDCVCGCPEPDEKLGQESQQRDVNKDPCRCADPTQPCYREHYKGVCGCNCGDGVDCGCDCILLARLVKTGTGNEITWSVDYRVRRFIRPVLMHDPKVERAWSAPAEPAAGQGATQTSSKKTGAKKVESV